MALTGVQCTPLYIVEEQGFWPPVWCLQLLQPGAVTGAWPSHHRLPLPRAGAALIQRWGGRFAGKCEAGEPAAEAFLRRVACDAGFVVGDG